MQVVTRDFGEIAVDNNDVLHFPKGLFAFENMRDFVLIHYPDQEVAPMWLQSVDDSSLCFIVFDPFIYVSEYNPSISESECNDLGCTNKDNLRYLVIAVVPEDVKKTTINLKSPIVINIDNNNAIQCILDKDYPIRFLLCPDDKGVD